MSEKVIIRVLRGAGGGYTAEIMMVLNEWKGTIAAHVTDKFPVIFSWNGHVPGKVLDGDEFGKIMVRQLKNHKFGDRVIRGGIYSFYSLNGDLIKDAWKKSSE